MTPKQIRTWLMANPRPVSIRVKPADGSETRIVDVSPGVTWSALADSVHALDPELLEALDGEGKISRVARPEEEPDEGEAETTEQTQVAANVSAAVANADAETQRLLVFGQLLAQAYRHSTDVAFERMVALFEACNRRSETLERSLDAMTRLLNRAVREQYDAASTALANVPEEGGLGGLISAFLQGKAKAEVEQAINGATNGTTAGKV
jgi:hypothetical protein